MGITLYQIRALTSFGDVREGDLGGFIESYDNLENDLEKGTAWIDKESKAFNKAIVRDYAKVESSNIFDNAVVDGYARLKECEVSGNAVITKGANISDASIKNSSDLIIFDANLSKNGAKSTFKTFTAYINRKGHQRIDSYKNETRSLTALKYDAKKNLALKLLVSKVERLFN